MQGAAVEPGDQQRTLLAERPVYIGGAQPLAADPDRQAGAARVLTLNREQAPRDGRRLRGWWSGETLGGEALGID